VTCPFCGTVTVPGARFCHMCGVAQPAAAALPAAERRVVTVLFGDLSDFTAWSEGVDPERVGTVTDRVLAALAGAVKTFGGHVDKLTGDGIMAVFGAPVAHEDDPERAVRAALAMQRAVRRVLDDERGGGAPAGLRIGINTGEVVAGVQASLEYTVIGDTVNTAARLADAATVGSVYAGASTSSVTRHVAAWRRLLPLRLKGKRHAVEAYELLGPLDAPGIRSGLGDEGPFVGRETEMALVTSRFAEVVDRQEPRALVFTAEAGLGKTRLAAEAARFAANVDRGGGSGARVLTVKCEAYGERWRLGPLSDLVRAAVGLPERPGAAATRAVAEERLRRVAHIVGRRTGVAPRLQTEQLLALLGYREPSSGQDGERPDPGRQTRDGAGVHLGEHPGEHRGGERAGTERVEHEAEAAPTAVAELLSALASEAPLLIIVDDLHDASPPTVDALGATLNRLTGPVLLILLGRPELVRVAGALTRLADAEVHTLPPLRGAEASRLLSAYLGGGRLAAMDTDRLLATAHGNPFYLAELVTMLIERGALISPEPDISRGREGALWRLAPQSMAGRLLSRDLAAVLAARIDALPPQSRAVLRDAAVIGDSVPASALDAVRDKGPSADARPAAVAALDLSRAMDELRHRRMLLPTRGGYVFATPLLREAAYAGVGKTDLADKHARMVRWAVALSLPVPSLGWTQDTLDAFIADHTERAAALADAVRLRPDAAARSVIPLGVAALGRLALRAIQAGEPGQAVHLSERAVRLSATDVPVADQLVHGSALFQLGRVGDALATAERVNAEAVDDAASRARALLLAGRAYRAQGDAERGDRAWADALAVATAADLALERGEALRRIGMEDYVRGRLREAESRYHEALAIAEESGDRRGQAWALQNLAWVTTTLGDFTAADANLGRAARLFAELADTSGRAWMRGTTAFTRLFAGRLQEARRLADAFLPFGERVGERWAVATLRAVGAFAAAELGDLAVAERDARRAYREFDEIDDDWGRGFALVVRAVVARSQGEPARALDLLNQACAFGDRTGHPLLLGVAHLVRGFVSLDLGDPVNAELDAHAAFAVVKTHDGADAARVGPRVLLGCAQLAADDPAAAVESLREAVAAEAEIASGGAASVLLSRRLVLAEYAAALLAAGRVDEAVDAARQAAAYPAEDVRSRVVAARVLARALAAAGELGEARAAAAGAVRAAYATAMVSERAAADASLAAVS
jgi:class 3 adenylate cyclase/tetratricopeptide (TPR) repeat protein